MKTRQSHLLVFGIFGGIGVCLLAGSLVAHHHASRFAARAVHAEGTVKELILSRSGSGSRPSSSYRPRVVFQAADGRQIEFVGDLGSNPPAFRPGERVPVLYLPEDPYSAGIGTFWQQWFLSILLAGMGTVFTAIGIGPILLVRREQRRRETLRLTGRAIQTRFEGVEQGGNLRRMGRRPYQIVTHWQDPLTGRLHVFRSENIWFDPTHYIDREQIAVRIDPQDPQNYLVDIGFLPELAD